MEIILKIVVEQRQYIVRFFRDATEVIVRNCRLHNNIIYIIRVYNLLFNTTNNYLIHIHRL